MTRLKTEQERQLTGNLLRTRLTMQQSIKQWFETIEDPEIRANAIANTSANRLKSQCTCLDNSLRLAFTWDKSPQGYKYYNNYMNTLIKKK